MSEAWNKRTINGTPQAKWLLIVIGKWKQYDVWVGADWLTPEAWTQFFLSFFFFTGIVNWSRSRLYWWTSDTMYINTVYLCRFFVVVFFFKNEIRENQILIEFFSRYKCGNRLIVVRREWIDRRRFVFLIRSICKLLKRDRKIKKKNVSVDRWACFELFLVCFSFSDRNISDKMCFGKKCFNMRE